jgi:hypothetical protein
MLRFFVLPLHMTKVLANLRNKTITQNLRHTQHSGNCGLHVEFLGPAIVLGMIGQRLPDSLRKPTSIVPRQIQI